MRPPSKGVEDEVASALLSLEEIEEMLEQDHSRLELLRILSGERVLSTFEGCG